MENYYEVLQVRNFAEPEVIKASYKALAKKYHPDANPAVNPAIMVSINEAFTVLSDTEKKLEYDHKLQEFLKQENSQNDKSDAVRQPKRRNYYSSPRSGPGIGRASVRFLRTLLSIPIAFAAGYLGNLLLMGFLDINGTWSFLLYVLYGALLGFIIKIISGSDSGIVGVIGGIICTITLILPYYEFLFETLPQYGVNLEGMPLMVEATKELIYYFFCNGIIRAAAIIFTPIATCSAISE